jgi:hypothetical protein
LFSWASQPASGFRDGVQQEPTDRATDDQRTAFKPFAGLPLVAFFGSTCTVVLLVLGSCGFQRADPAFDVAVLNTGSFLVA